MRLWVKDACDELVAGLRGLAGALLDRAERDGDAVLPGYTHGQRAQPVWLGQHLAAHVWALIRDIDRFHAVHRRADTCPSGAGALAGSSLPLDPAAVASELGFAAVHENPMDAVSDRDYCVELVFACTLAFSHLSRIAEELVLWTSAEYGFAELDDSAATGSSMMPQKKNPDAAELVRGRAGTAAGRLAGLLATLKGLPLAYNRDLQEDKRACVRRGRRPGRRAAGAHRVHSRDHVPSRPDGRGGRRRLVRGHRRRRGDGARGHAVSGGPHGRRGQGRGRRALLVAGAGRGRRRRASRRTRFGSSSPGRGRRWAEMASRSPGLRRIVVVKVGSSTLVDDDGRARTEVFARLAGECAELQADGVPVVLVSSGAVALGVGELDGRARRRGVGDLQAASAVGQTLLQDHWRAAFAAHGVRTGAGAPDRGGRPPARVLRERPPHAPQADRLGRRRGRERERLDGDRRDHLRRQ